MPSTLSVPFAIGQAVIWARPSGLGLSRPVAAKLRAYNDTGAAYVDIWDRRLARLRTIRVAVADLALPADPLPAEWPAALLAPEPQKQSE